MLRDEQETSGSSLGGLETLKFMHGEAEGRVCAIFKMRKKINQWGFFNKKKKLEKFL